jgi:hypothetical protein
MKTLLLSISIALVPLLAEAQCFSSAGNPVGGSNNMGVLDKGTLSVVGYYRYSNSDRFFEGSKISDIRLIRNARYSFLGSLIAYGVSNKFTVESEVGYFINKVKTYSVPDGYSLCGAGLTNAVLSGKYQFYFNPEKKIEFSAAAGIKFPFTLNSLSVENVRLPFDLQPSTSTFGCVLQAYLIKEHSFTGMRYFLYSRAEVNATNRDGYRFGNVMVNSIYISRHLIRTSSWPVSGTVILQIRNEIRGRSSINQEVEPASGSVKFFLTPQINLSFHEKTNLSFLVDFPVYQTYQNAQIADKFSFAVVLNRPFLL